MFLRFLLPVLSLAWLACGFQASLGPADGIRFEDDVANPALVAEGQGTGQVTIERDIVLISEAQSQDYFEDLGADEIGALRGVTSTIVGLRIDGVDLARSAPPELTLAGHAVSGVAGESIELDDEQVEDLRPRLLCGAEVRGPLLVTLDAPLEALDETRPELHIVLVIQPTLHVDVSRAL